MSAEITIENLEQFTPRQVADFIIDRLEAQGCRCYSDRAKACMYRMMTDDGRVLRCAAGQLIPDRLYDKDFESRSWGELRSKCGVFCDQAIPEQIDSVISMLQTTHDKGSRPFGSSIDVMRKYAATLSDERVVSNGN